MVQIKDGIRTSRGHHTAEGPIWDPQRRVFFYTDIENGTLHCYAPRHHHTTTWQIGAEDQAIGGIVALNQDGSVLLVLEGGPNAGVNYFDPETGHLLTIPNSWPETDKPQNRPNDGTVVTIEGKGALVFGTMSKAWQEEAASNKRAGAFYLLDPDLNLKKLTIDAPYSGPVICNGLAGGAQDESGALTLFWAESIGTTPDDIKVWKGRMSPLEPQIKDVQVFADYNALTGGEMAFPDGANMILLDNQPAYAVAILALGEIRAFHPESGQLLRRIPLPAAAKNITKFAIGENTRRAPALFITTVNFEYPENKERENGAAFLLPLPQNIRAHPASLQTTHYISLEDVEAKFNIQPCIIPSTSNINP